jgi:hypothetical protein
LWRDIPRIHPVFHYRSRGNAAEVNRKLMLDDSEASLWEWSAFVESATLGAHIAVDVPIKFVAAI